MQDDDENKKKEEEIKKEYGRAARQILDIINREKKETKENEDER